MALDQQTLDGWVKAYPGLEDLYPATEMQLGLVFHSLLDDRQTAYATQVQVDFEAGFDVDAFRRAWTVMLSRHAIFRTAFVGLDREQPLQIVVKDAPLEWREEDWRALDGEAQEAAFARHLECDKGRGFDFARGPLMRMSLVRLSQHRYRWLWTHHHSLLDGWSVAIVMRELFEQYDGILSGRKVTLPRRADYRSYIAWLCTQDRRAAEDYWRDALSGVTPTRLGLSEPRASAAGAAQEQQGLEIPAERTEALRKVAQRHGVTLNTVMQGAWAYLLHRYSGEREVVFGQTVSGRSTAEVAGIDAMVGLFINTLPVPVKITRNVSIGEWLRGLQQEQARRESHGYLPLVEINRLTGLRAGESLFDTLLVFENYPVRDSVNESGSVAARPRLEFGAVKVHEGPNYGLTLVAIPARELSLKVLYHPTRYSQEAIAALLGSLAVILDGLADAGMRQMQDLPYLSKADSAQWLARSATSQAARRDQCIHERFEEQVRQRPDAVALVHESGDLTYEEMNRRANQLAHHLIERGVRPELRVGLCIEDAAERAIGMLGILKAGGCYVPLDPGYPALRLTHLIEESGIEWLVGNRAVEKSLEWVTGDGRRIERICLDADYATSTENPGTQVWPENLAHAIYSADGSGELRGVLGSHRSVDSLATSHYRSHGMAFEIATLDWLMELLSGSADRLRVDASLDSFLLGPEGEPLPCGVAGELHLGGAGLSRGYSDQPGLTAETFVPHPFSDQPGERLFRTGDLARRRSDGTLEYLGRVTRAKVRGDRSELAEIESTLRAHAAVREAVVVAREDCGEARLVCYVVAAAGAQSGEAALVKELRGRLREQLPGCRVPAFVVLDSLPLTAAGKLDRQALPAPETPAFTEFTPPEGITEELLAELWCVVLKRERAGRHENFFELGGHSLLATQLASRIRETFSVELPVRELFEHATLSSQARAVERARGVGALADVAMEAVARDAPLPLSYAQQRLWFLQQYLGPNAVYNMPLALRLRGKVDEAALLRSLEELHRRHESLRTRFETRAGSAVQVIDPPELVKVELVSAAEARAIALAERFHRFDLASERLCRIRLLRATGDGSDHTTDYALLVTMHHSVSDGWSLGIFFRELVSSYRAYANGESSPLPPLPIQYADYAQWQRRWLQGEVLEKQLSYWREQLTGLPPLLTLPTDRPRPAEQTFRGSTESFALPASLAGRLQALSREQGVTLYMTLLSAFAVLLGRYAGQQDVAIGTPIANRTRRETEGLIGFFVNTLVMRHDLHGDPRFTDLLKQTREIALQAYAHQDIPFEQLVESLNPARSLSHSPLFQVSFGLQNVPFESLELAGLEVLPLETAAAEGDAADTPEGTARFDLMMSVQESTSGLVGAIEYNTDLFDRSTIRRMSGHYARLLAAIVAAPRSRLSHLKMLGEEEQRQLLVEWNATSCAYPQDKCVHELFEATVERQPDAIALLHEGSQLSFRELNRRANQVARCLREQGVGPDARVGICMERSAEMMIAILGVLKAGGAYVPLDPGYPPQRLRYLVNDAAPAALLVDAVGREALDELAPSVRVLDVPAEESRWTSYSGENVRATDVGLTSNHSAYVIYTSGSTGAPKAAMVGHAQVINLWQGLESGVYAATRGAVRSVSVNASFSFDASVQQFVQLLSGRTLTIIPEAVRVDPDELWAYLARHGVEGFDCTPSTLEAVVAAKVIERHRYVPKAVLVGGEAFNARLWAACRELPAVAFYNVYGPTECTVDSTLAAVRREDEPRIGQPLSNAQIYVVDRDLQPVPAGVTGELCIGGAGLSRGYLNRPGLTAEKFIPHPFSAQPGQRVYRTGDLGRWLPDGKLECFGRVDTQVKVRGYRIELGEIESVLLAHEEVRDAVVVALPDDSGGKRLAVYLVAEAGATAIAASLVSAVRSRLQQQLPGYMVPSSFVVLESLPLTANGKLDRQALPAPDAPVSESELMPPQSATEELLAQLWRALLKRECVGRHDNFFELGGHSLLATQLVSRIRETFSIGLPVRQVFEHPTLSAQARAIELMRGAGALVDAAIEVTAREQPLPLSFAQQRLWFLHQYMGPNAVYNMPLALRLRGDVHEAALVRSLEELQRRHESLRTRFQSHDGGAVQIIDPPQLVKVEPVSADEARALVRTERFYCFDLLRERLCRIRLLRVPGSESGDYALLVTMHHSVSDGWSLGILFRELVSLYRAYARGETSPLVPLPIQYADYAKWQRGWLRGDVLEQQLAYWREQLKVLPPLLTLPTDRPRPIEQTFRGSMEPVAVPASVAQRLQVLSREQGVTSYMTLLSAFAVLLGRYAGQQDVLVGTPIANRTRRETEGVIGFFANTLVMRHDLSGDPRFIDLLKCTRAMALQAYAHQDVPFEQLVEELNPERSVSHSPLFQVAFSLQNAPSEAFELPGLEVQPLYAVAAEEDGEEAPEGTARFDLTLNMHESPSGLAGVLEYNTDLFDRGTIRRLSEHYTRLLAAIAAAPQARLSRLEMLGDAERQRQLIEWNPSPANFPRAETVQELLEERANRSPDAIAVVDGDRQLTYRELNERANVLAHRLIGQGVAPGSVVGLRVETDAERTIGLLGILKAGGAFVPLNPDDPAERLDYLLEDCRVESIVTQTHLRDEFPGGYSSTNPSVAVNAADLACVRYAADGAQGPAGRMVSHLGLLQELIVRGEEPGGGSIASLAQTEAKIRGAAHYVLDHGALLPVGAVGELYLGGEAAGWGYRHRPGLTAERFVPNAFAAIPGERLYRTGERARWTAGGKLELVERHPESSRNHENERIEIERVLLSHQGVREAAVVALDPSRLAAYVVERAPGAMPADEFVAQLKLFLRTQPQFQRLPEEWMLLESLPRTAAGAVDCLVLPQPGGPAEKLTYVAPRTELEKTLVEVWQEQLGIETVGVEDDYFALGGDSIRSISLVAQARQRGVDFSIKDLFAHPTVSALAAAIERGEVRSDAVEEELGPFALLTEPERDRLAARPDLEDAYPLSMMQQGMVLESLRHAGLRVYQNGHCYQFSDAWDAQLFEQALLHVMGRHPMLRTVYDFSGERPLQLVLKVKSPGLNVVDVRHLDKTAIQAALDQWGRKETAEPLEMSSSLWRLTIHVLSEQSFIFGIYVHHAQWDGWSLESFATELYATYGLLKREGRVAEYRPLPSYNQFVALEQSMVSSQEHRKYWLQKLEGATVPWWTGREKSASALIPCEISEHDSHALIALARSLGVQEKSVWCSVYLALLSLLSGTDDGLGTVMTQGRPEIPGGDKIIGMFLNALPMRAAMSGRWVDLIASTDRELTEQYAFRHYPVAEIQRQTGLDFSATMFNYTNWHVYYEGVDREGTREEWVPQKVGGWQDTNHLLSVFVEKDDKTQGHLVSIGADVRVFDAAFRERIRGYVAAIIRSIAGDATGVIEKTALLSDAERHQQLVEWNATARAYQHDKCIHELFEAQARLRPDAIALVHDGGELTYRELNRRSNRLAQQLIERGVSPEVRVGLCMPRSAEMVIGVLGILKAGGCYVPLDPDYPRKRLDYLLEDAQIGLVVTEPGVAPRVAGQGRDLLLLTAAVPLEPSAGSVLDVDGRARGLRPEHPAYLIYTSASTGTPKGVLGLHRGIVNRVNWLARSRGVGPEEVLCQKTSLGFVDHVAEIFQALSAGVPLVIIAPEVLQVPRELLRELDARRVTQLTLVPSLLKTVLEAGRGERARWLKSIHSSGEALHVSGLEKFSACFPQARLFNIYGSTEMGADVTCQALQAESFQSAAQWAPIGKGIDNTQAYILDAGQLVVSGAVGELHIGGVCLARGYFKRAGLTAEKFVPHRFGGEPGERLYRTGDLARWLPDGTLEYLGRIDTQVKVRGFRIELGEIERVLRAHAAVRDAVVAVREESGDQRLVGYVVAKPGGQWDDAALIQELRSHLQEQLPAYLVPAAFVVLESLPLTATGKLDRKALPAPEASALAEYAPPEGATEELLAALWCALLKRERVGRHDSFFELGGHSLLVMQLASRIRETFSTDLPVRELFERATLSSQARAVEQARGAGALVEVAMEAVSREQPLPLSYAQQRLWFLHQYLGPNAVYNMPLALRLHGEVNEAALVRSLEELQRRHESLRTRFATRDGSAVQVIDPPQLVKVEPVSAADAQAIASAERFYCFDLSSERLCRIRLLRETGSESGDYALLVTMHHSVSDGWSLGIFFQELLRLYRAYAQGEDSPLTPLPIQYADYAQWQRAWLQGAVLERQVSYWREQLKDLPPLLTLPTDRPRPAGQTFRGSTEHFALPLALTERLQALSREQGATLYMTLLSAFAMLLGRYSGQQDVAVGTPIANRTRRETEGLIGFFVNTLVMRHDLRGDPRFIDLLECTRETALQAYAHQDVPFERLVEALNPERSAGHSPLFQVSFALLNMPLEPIEVSGLAVQPLRKEIAPEGTARFDLTLNMQDSPSGLMGGLEYNTDLFDRGTIQRMAAHYERLLAGIVKSPRSRLSRLEMLGEEEQRQQLLEWNATSRAYPDDTCIHRLFEEQAKLRPDAVALVYEGSELTYRELNRRANRLAQRLIERGVGPEVRVGLCMQRSVGMVIGLLGILKAGGCYVPLDPNHPQQRLAYAVADSGLALMVGDPSHWTFIDPAQRPVCVSVEDGGRSDAPPQSSPDESNPDDYPPSSALAYVIYTSGSTGKPKGVRVSHGNVVNFLLGMREKLGIGSRDRLLAVTTLSFDIALLELYLPLTVGATVDIAPAASVVDGERLIGRLEESRITLLQATPVTWKLLLDSGWQGLERLTALVGGEAFSRELATRILGKVGRVWNLYGPTETTIWSACLSVEAVETSTVPIGKPIANTQLYVLDDQQQLVPAGTVGPLYVAGAGVAQGYLSRPGLTAEKFIPHPFSAAPGERLYSTGDLARWLPDGTLEYLGRVDNQVKLRGFRIELGEIESVLLAHEGVRDAVVVVREDSGDKQLVGYVVAKSGSQAGDVTLIPELRSRLLEQLPGYMVPAAFVVLESLPLTANGKLDRKALPSPEAAARAEYVAPAGATEELLAQLWSSLLKRERVGRHDDFFALGGHSLLATQLAARIQQAFEVEIALTTVFQCHVLHDLAACIEREIELGALDSEAVDRLSEAEAAELLKELEQTA